MLCARAGRCQFSKARKRPHVNKKKQRIQYLRYLVVQRRVSSVRECKFRYMSSHPSIMAYVLIPLADSLCAGKSKDKHSVCGIVCACGGLRHGNTTLQPRPSNPANHNQEIVYLECCPGSSIASLDACDACYNRDGLRHQTSASCMPRFFWQKTTWHMRRTTGSNRECPH
jgi:hypothetical protein